MGDIESDPCSFCSLPKMFSRSDSWGGVGHIRSSNNREEEEEEDGGSLHTAQGVWVPFC